MTSEPTPNAPAVDPPPPSSGWVTPASTGHDPAVERSTNPVLLALAWLTGVVVVGFLAWLRMGLADGSEGYRLGVAVGAFVAPFAVAIGMRWLLVRFRRGQPGASRGVLRSGWTPLGAALLATLAAAGTISSAVPPSPTDPALAMRVGSPYTLREADAATTQQVEQIMRDDSPIGAVAVREVVGDDGSVSILVAVDGRLRDGAIEDVARGVQDASGVATTVETIEGREMAVALGPEVSIASWIEAPLLVSVYASDEATLRAIVASVLATPRS